jgi:hypothetical protein
MHYHIEAVTVNHSTSAYMELMLRSLFARHTPDLDLALTVFDNASEDDTAGLRAYAERMGVPIIPSGFTTSTLNNSHGEILRRFVLEQPHCTHYLFLDSDVCFVEDNMLGHMLDELEADPTAFAVSPRMSWDGAAELPEELWPNVYESRLHPCCALVKNTELFRRVVTDIGLSCMKYLWADREEYLDTFQLMTRVMGTHGLRYLRSSAMILHFFCVSYDWDPDHFKQEKARRRDALLTDLREPQ